MACTLNPLLDRLYVAFPAASSRKAAQPLKSGLGEERLALASVHSALANLRRTRRRRALKVHTGALAYRKALARGGPRYDLAGQPAGKVMLEQRADTKKPRPEPPASPATSYVKMTLKRQI